ncbi:pseudouridine synthase [uncultured Methylobacterium sp.]|uniref:pseudouridine synthase n=1 Tax=uncultured Methylobacterium sp. TaxID=157278 RepID=UPI0035C99929
MSDNPTNPIPDEPVRGSDPAQRRDAESWSPATDANVRSEASEAQPRARIARDRSKDRTKDRHANARPAKDRGGDAPLRRRPAPAEAAPVEPDLVEPDLVETDSVDADLIAPASAEPTEPALAEPAEAPAILAAPEPAATPDGERIAKAIARAGLASRRDAEAMIGAGRVTLNGRVLDSPAINVTDADRITVDGEPLPARERTRLWVFHKPRGLVTTARDPEGRQTVFEVMPEEMPRVVAIGRLDINTEGLLLLTNDGGLAKVIAHPDTGWLRRYRVRAHGDTTQAELDKLRHGVTIDGMEYGAIEASLDRVQGDNLWLTLGLREGKNREVKRILEHLGLSVNRLIRLSFGPFQLGDLEVGLTEEIRTKVLKEQLGKGLSEQAGVDFESPVREPIAPFGSPKKAQGPADQGERPRRDDAPRARAPSGGRPMRPAAPARMPTGGLGSGPRRSVWRADQDQNPDAVRPGKVPRRGADPKAERAVAAERGRERVGAINAGERRVLVERLSASPATPDAEAPRRRYARDESGAKPPRQPRRDDRDGQDGPRPDRAREPRFDAGPARAAPRTDRGTGFRGGEGGDRPRARSTTGERRDGARSEGRPEGGRIEGGKPGGSGKPGGYGGKPGGFAKPGSFAKPGGFVKSGGDREGGYRGRTQGGKPGGEGGFRPRTEGGYKGRTEGGGQGRPGASAGRPAGAKFGGKPGGFGGKPGGFGAKPGGRPGGARPTGGGRPPRSGGR